MKGEAGICVTTVRVASNRTRPAVEGGSAYEMTDRVCKCVP